MLLLGRWGMGAEHAARSSIGGGALSFLSRLSCRVATRRGTAPSQSCFDRRRYFATEAETLEKIRNIGIIAHVDAGKTTTAERMLFYSGVVRSIGDVDRGDTTLDFLKMERDRGITIQSAAITFDWMKHKINLIDTPGHVDFTAEVERSVRVLDGAVAIFDAIAGVQAQTETVWRQADRYQVPRIGFLNKMDREGAGPFRTIEMLSSRFGITPLLLQLPLGAGGGPNYIGAIDLITMETIRYQDKQGYELAREKLADDGSDLYKMAWEKLIESIADLDDAFMEEIMSLEGGPQNVSLSSIHAALRRITIAMKGVPLLVGAAFRNRGVQPLLDAVVRYLPSPNDRPPVEALVLESKDNSRHSKKLKEKSEKKTVSIVPDSTKELCALAFKVVHDQKRGLVVYFRVYSGTLRLGDTLQNTVRNTKERLMRLYQINADEFVEITEITAGNIGAALGLRSTCTGDTLISSKSNNALQLKGVVIPPPVFICNVEPESTAQQEALDTALELLKKEDPSFHVTFDKENNQTLMSGMGELHLDIISDRLLTHYRVPARVGKMRVSYRTAIKTSATTTHEISTDKARGTEQAYLELELNPASELGEEELSVESNVDLPSEIFEAIKEGVASAFSRGITCGFPLYGIHVQLIKVGLENTIPTTTASITGYKFCAAQAVLKAARTAESVLLEPVMSVEVSVDESNVGTILSDLTGVRRATIDSVDSTIMSDGNIAPTKIVRAIVPLKEMIGYSNALRSLTQGVGSFTMEFNSYGEVNAQETKQIMRDMTYGY